MPSGPSVLPDYLDINFCHSTASFEKFLGASFYDLHFSLIFEQSVSDLESLNLVLLLRRHLLRPSWIRENHTKAFSPICGTFVTLVWVRDHRKDHCQFLRNIFFIYRDWVRFLFENQWLHLVSLPKHVSKNILRKWFYRTIFKLGMYERFMV